jgi:hypothetical protein
VGKWRNEWEKKEMNGKNITGEILLKYIKLKNKKIKKIKSAGWWSASTNKN